ATPATSGRATTSARLERGGPAGEPVPTDDATRARLGEEADHDVAGVRGIDHVVDQVPGGRAVGQGVQLPLGEQLLAARRALLGGEAGQLRAVDDVHAGCRVHE